MEIQKIGKKVRFGLGQSTLAWNSELKNFNVNFKISSYRGSILGYYSVNSHGPMFFDYNREAEYFGKDKRDNKLNIN